MAIDLSTLSAKIRARLKDDEERDIQPTGFKVVSETSGSSVLASIRTATSSARTSQPSGLVRTVLEKAPAAIGGGISSYLKSEEEKRSTMSLGEKAVYDLVEKPAKILKAVSVDLPRAILGGLSSVGKTALEAIYSPVFGKEQTRAALKGDEQSQAMERMLFGSETKSWQEIKEDVDAYTAQSPVATEWEKKNLGFTLAIAGFTADAWVGGGGKSKIAGKVLKELAETADEAVVKQILTNTKMPRELAEAAAPRIVLAKTPQEVQKAVTDAAQVLLKQADNAADEAASKYTRTLNLKNPDDVEYMRQVFSDENVDGFLKGNFSYGRYKNDKAKIEEILNARIVDEAYTKPKVATSPYEGSRTFFHGTSPDSAAAIKKQGFKRGSDLPEDAFRGGGYGQMQRSVSFSSDAEMASRFTGSGSKGEVIRADLKPDAKVVTASDIEDAVELNDYVDEFLADGVDAVWIGGGEKELVVLNPDAMKVRDSRAFEVANAKGAFDDFTAEPQFPARPAAKPAAAETRKTARGFTKEEAPIVAEVDNSPSFKAPSAPKKGTPAEVAAYRDERGKISQLKDAFIEQVQDEMIRVRRLVNNKSLKITDASNPYDAEIAFHGRVGYRLEQLKETTIAIDKEIITASKKSSIPSEQLTKEVNEYLIARHAPERNAALKDGAAGIKTADAQARMAELEKLPYAGELKRIANKIQTLNNQTLDILKEGEVITDELFDTLRTKYKNHIPLYRVMEDEEDFAGALGKGFDVKGTGIKTATGSDKEVMDVLGNVAFNYEQAIIRAEKNRVDLATLHMVRENEEALKDMFKIRHPKVVGQTWSGKPIMEQITDPQILVMREKGKVTLIEIKDPQLAIALRGVGREKLNGMMRGVAAVTRFYSGVHTRFNPEFAFSNKIRDIQEVLVYSAAQSELRGKGAGKVAAKELRLENERAVIDVMMGRDSEGARLYKQMREDGGTTGGMGLSTRKQVELDMTEIRKLNRSNPRKAAHMVLEYVDRWNTIFEDSSRLSVYRAALDGGATRQRAAVLAKESSVNFNKFGKQGAIINSLYMFSNASIQGTTKMLRAMKNPKVAAAVTTTVFGSVYAVAEWNDSVDPDWRNKITTWDRLNSLAVMLPTADGEGVQYVTLPVSWGIKPIKVMADEAFDLLSGHSTGVVDAAGAVLTAAVEAYNPAGGSDVIAGITPTILDIPFDVARNQSWSGAAIRPDWDRNAPPSIQYFASLRDSSTGRIAVGISKGLSGIGVEISPADIYYSYEQLIGGAGRAVNKTVNTLAAFGQGTLPEAKDVPFMSRFYKTRPDEEVGAGAKEFEMIANILEEQSRERFYLNQKAEDSYQQLKALPATEAARLFNEIKANDPELAKEIAKTKKDDDKGLTFIDRKIIQLGVANGERAKFLYDKFNELENKEDKANLWREYKAKGILSKEVEKQLRYLLEHDGSTE